MTKDEAATKIMDYVGDYSCRKFILSVLDEYSRSQNSGKPIVSGSLELLQLLLNKEQELHDKTEHRSVLASTSQKIQAIQMVQDMISDYVANDR